MDPLTGSLDDISFERVAPWQRVLKAALVNPLANHLPPGLFRAVLRLSKSELARSNWDDPGGWRSMVISYDGQPRQIADKILVKAGAIPMALRNRRKLAARVLARLIDDAEAEPVHVLCVGAGPGRIIMDAMQQSSREARATLVDLNSDPFDHGREQARAEGLEDKLHFVRCDVRDGLGGVLNYPPDIVKMIGICEYLEDAQIVDLTRTVAKVMPAGAPIVLNSLSESHGTDRFFRRVFGLHMIHRSPEQLEALMDRAGFGQFVAYPEPLGVYQVLAGRRSDQPVPIDQKGPA